MRAILATKYGGPDVLEFLEVIKPSPRDNEVLIRIESTVAAFSDCAFRKGKPIISRLFTGLVRPRQIPGDVFAGVIESVGKAVSQFKAGDEVYGSSGSSFGTNAEYMVLSEDGAIAAKPKNISYEEAAAISEGALTALSFLRDNGKIKEGQKVLIIGASGGVGVYAVQIAKLCGADVTAVCGHRILNWSKRLAPIGPSIIHRTTLQDHSKNTTSFLMRSLKARSHDAKKHCQQKGSIFRPFRQRES